MNINEIKMMVAESIRFMYGFLCFWLHKNTKSLISLYRFYLIFLTDKNSVRFTIKYFITLLDTVLITGIWKGCNCMNVF